MKIKELLKDCTINPPNVVICLLINKAWLEIEIWEYDDCFNFILEYGDRDVIHWSIDNIDGDTYIFFNIKKLVKE
jgi:hypothetical protein